MRTSFEALLISCTEETVCALPWAHALRQRLDARDALRESLHEFGDAVKLLARFIDLRYALADALLLLLHDGEGALDLRGVFRDERRDLLRCCFRLLGELSHLFSDDGETLARFAGACSFDGSV